MGMRLQHSGPRQTTTATQSSRVSHPQSSQYDGHLPDSLDHGPARVHIQSGIKFRFQASAAGIDQQDRTQRGQCAVVSSRPVIGLIPCSLDRTLRSVDVDYTSTTPLGTEDRLQALLARQRDRCTLVQRRILASGPAVPPVAAHAPQRGDSSHVLVAPRKRVQIRQGRSAGESLLGGGAHWKAHP